MICNDKTSAENNGAETQKFLDAVDRVAALNLQAVTAFCRQIHGWSAERADRIELEYRRFLVLYAVEPDGRHVGTIDVDNYWHAHILHTRFYAADCQAVLGRFLHHDPDLIEIADDVVPFTVLHQATNARYVHYFGEVPTPATGEVS